MPSGKLASFIHNNKVGQIYLKDFILARKQSQSGRPDPVEVYFL